MPIGPTHVADCPPHTRSALCHQETQGDYVNVYIQGYSQVRETFKKFASNKLHNGSR